MMEPLPVTVPKDVCSADLARVPAGTNFDVIEVAEEPVDGELRARIASPAGWISTQTANGSFECVSVATCPEQIPISEAQPGSPRSQFSNGTNQSSENPASFGTVLTIQSFWRRKQAERHVALVRLIYHEARERAMEKGALSQTGETVSPDRWRAVRDSVCARVLEAAKTCTKTLDFVHALESSARRKKRIRELRLKIMVAHKFAEVAHEKAAERIATNELWKKLMPLEESASLDDNQIAPFDTAADKIQSMWIRKNKKRCSKLDQGFRHSQRQAAAAARHVMRLNGISENSCAVLCPRNGPTNEFFAGPRRECHDEHAKHADSVTAKNQELAEPPKLMTCVVLEGVAPPKAPATLRRIQQHRKYSRADNGVAREPAAKDPFAEMERRLEERIARSCDAGGAESTQSQLLLGQTVLPPLQRVQNRVPDNGPSPVQNRIRSASARSERGAHSTRNAPSLPSFASAGPMSARSQSSRSRHNEHTPPLGSAAGSRETLISSQRQQGPHPKSSFSLAGAVMMGSASDGSQSSNTGRDKVSTVIAFPSPVTPSSGNALWTTSRTARARSRAIGSQLPV